MNPLKPFNSVGAQRRSLLQGLALGAAGAWAGTPLAWAQPGKPASTARGVSVAQVVDMSASQIERMNKEYITTIDAKLTVALEADPRPAVTMNAAPLFGAVSEAAPAAPSLPSWLS